MKRAFRLLPAALLLMATPVAVTAQDDGGTTTEGTVEIGGWDASTSGSPDIVSEYEPNDGGPLLRLDLSSFRDNGALELEAEVRDSNDYSLLLDFDVNRSVRSRTAVTGLLHRLHRESLDHFAAATGHGRLTRHTDLTPEQVFEIDYSLLEHRTEFQPRSAPNLTLAVGYRQQDREGFRQATTISHCDSCHVIGQTRPIDESTSDASLEARMAFEKGEIGASFTSRSLDADPTTISLLFDDALHPELRVPVFDNRLQWDSAEGPQPIFATPDIDKDIFKVDSVLSDVGGFVATAEGVWSQTENQLSNLEADYSGYLITLARNFKKDWSFRWRGRAYTLDNEDIFVDNVERLGIAGPQAGRTYREIYGFDPDYLRESALNRDVVESRADLTHRLGKKAGRLRFFWEYEDIDRDHYQVAPGETGTTTQILGASWWARPKKGWKTQLAYEHGDVDNPFVNVNGAFSTLTSPAVPNPFDPNSAQYYEFHAARIADIGSSPAQWDEIKLRTSYTSGNTTFSGTLRQWDGDNDEGDLSEWSRKVDAGTLTVWSKPAPEWEWQLAYSVNRTELGAPASIALFDG